MPAQEITPDQVAHVAKLARLSLDQGQIQKFATQLEGILEYVAKIKTLNTEGVEPMAHALPISNVLRDDTVTPGLPIEQVLQNAPDTDGPFFKVPKVIGDDDSAG